MDCDYFALFLSVVVVVTTSLTERDVYSSIPGPVKSIKVLPTTRHRRNVSSKMYGPSDKERRRVPSLVTRFGVYNTANIMKN